MSRPILGLEGIKVIYSGSPILDIPSLDVQEGMTLAVIGPNGAGKTFKRCIRIWLMPGCFTITQAKSQYCWMWEENNETH